MLVMLRHLDPKHRFFSKGFVSRQQQQRVADPKEGEKKDVMKKIQADLNGMPVLRGSNPKAKSAVYNQLKQVKKPTRKEKEENRSDFQRLLAQDESRADQADMNAGLNSLELNVP